MGYKIIKHYFLLHILELILCVFLKLLLYRLFFYCLSNRLTVPYSMQCKHFISLRNLCKLPQPTISAIFNLFVFTNFINS